MRAKAWRCWIDSVDAAGYVALREKARALSNAKRLALRSLGEDRVELIFRPLRNEELNLNAAFNHATKGHACQTGKVRLDHR